MQPTFKPGRESKQSIGGPFNGKPISNGALDKKPFYSMKKPGKQVNIEEPRNGPIAQNIGVLGGPVRSPNGLTSEKLVKLPNKEQGVLPKSEIEKYTTHYASNSQEKGMKRPISKKDLLPTTPDIARPKPKKTPDKAFNLFTSKVASSKYDTPDHIIRPPKDKEKDQAQEKLQTPTKLASNEKPNMLLPRPHPHPEAQALGVGGSHKSIPKKGDNGSMFEGKPFLQGIFNVLSKSKERRPDGENPNRSANTPGLSKSPSVRPPSELNQSENVPQKKEQLSIHEKKKDYSQKEAIGQTTPSNGALPRPKSRLGLKKPSGNSPSSSRYLLNKSLSNKKISASPSPPKSDSLDRSNSNKSINSKSNSREVLNKKLHERSEIAQNSFKMNLQDLINLDEIFNLLIAKQAQEQVVNNFEMLRHFLVNNYCFILKDLNLLFYNEKFREVMRSNYLKELLYFVIMYIILFKNNLESLALQEKTGNSSKGGRVGDRLSIRKYISSINQETEELILQVLSYVHIVFIIRTEIFMDRAAVYYQNHKTYRELQLLLSKRKSKYNINTLKKDNYDHYVYKVNRYLDLCEQALHELCKLNPLFAEVSGVLVEALDQLNARKGELGIRDFNLLFAKFRIQFDSKGLSEFDLSPILALIHSDERLLEPDEDLHDVEVPVPPFLKLPRPKHKTLTLVIDLDETLIHYPDEHLEDPDGRVELAHFRIRPHCIEFLEQLSLYYELVIFTAASQNYADLIVDHIDPRHLISHRLYRQHLSVHNNKLIKDLAKIGRDLKSVIILDNMPENFSLQPDNGIYIKSWRGEEQDKCLLWLLPVFVNIANMFPEDVRDVMQELKKMLVESIK